MTKKKSKERPGLKAIFRKSRQLKNGRIIYAKDYGLKAFVIWVKQ